MYGTNDLKQTEINPLRPTPSFAGTCLTGVSIKSLIGYAIIISTALWLGILSVL